MDTHQNRDQGTVGRVPRSLPEDLLTPSYQNRLRTIGRQCDLAGYRSVTLLEVDGGFIGRAVRRRGRDIELMQFPDDDFPEQMILATESRGGGDRGEVPSVLAPTGWEDLLRAIGRLLDENYAACVVIAESPTAVLVSGETHPPNRDFDWIELVLDLGSITELLDNSFRLRGEDGTDQAGGI